MVDIPKKLSLYDDNLCGKSFESMFCRIHSRMSRRDGHMRFCCLSGEGNPLQTLHFVMSFFNGSLTPSGIRIPQLLILLQDSDFSESFPNCQKRIHPGRPRGMWRDICLWQWETLQVLTANFIHFITEHDICESFHATTNQPTHIHIILCAASPLWPMTHHILTERERGASYELITYSLCVLEYTLSALLSILPLSRSLNHSPRRRFWFVVYLDRSEIKWHCLGMGSRGLIVFGACRHYYIASSLTPMFLFVGGSASWSSRSNLEWNRWRRRSLWFHTYIHDTCICFALGRMEIPCSIPFRSCRPLSQDLLRLPDGPELYITLNFG